MTIGPVQLLVIGFDEPNFSGAIQAELKRLREHDLVRLIDAIAVYKDADGVVTERRFSNLTAEEAVEFGAVVGGLIGLGAAGPEGAVIGAEAGAEAMESGEVFDEETLVDVIGEIPAGSAAAIALLEHRWAIPLRDAIVEAGGVPVVDEWVHARDLVAVGLIAGADADVATTG